MLLRHMGLDTALRAQGVLVTGRSVGDFRVGAVASLRGPRGAVFDKHTDLSKKEECAL